MGQRWIICLLVLSSVLGVESAGAASAQERLAQQYLEVAVRGNAERMLSFYHPDEVTELRNRVLRVLEAEAAAGGITPIRDHLFGVVSTLQDVQRLTPSNLYLRLTERTGMPTTNVGQIKVLGVVEESEQLAHVVARLTPPEKSGERAQMSLVSLIRHGKGWKVAMPTRFQNQVDELLKATSTPAAAFTEEPSAPNTKGIDELLNVSIELLRNGDCAEYFNEQMSPEFRATISLPALKRLVLDCERNIDTRETYIAALQIAKDSAPKYENNGTRATYNMAGKGLPFKRFVVEKIENRWYVAE